MEATEGGGMDLELGDISSVEDVLDREALVEVCRGVYDLFGLSVRILSPGGALLGQARDTPDICAYLNTLPGGRAACSQTVSQAQAHVPGRAASTCPCFSGAVYRVEPIEYQGRQIGRVVIGPYLPAEMTEVPHTLLGVDPALDQPRAGELLAQMPRVREPTARRIGRHLRGVLDLLIFSNHRARLTNEMHVASVRASYRDLAEKTAKLQAAHARLQELDRLKSNFLATISHELRTPLTSIIGYSEMLESGIAGALEGEQLEFIQTIHAKGDLLLALITSLLDLAKLEQGNLTLVRAPIDAAALLEEAVETMLPMARRREIALHMESEAELPAILGDPIRLRQVLFNLLENALKFTPDGGDIWLAATAGSLRHGSPSGRGQSLMRVDEPAVMLAIRDSGIGISQAELPKIFDAFYQVDGSSTRAHGGAGLGLSIVQRLVDAHGGRVEVQSARGEGTTFWIKLPVSEESA